LSAAGAIVIAADKGLAQAPHALNDLVGRRSIAYDIAEVPNHIVCGGRLEYRFKSIDIGVDVGDEERAHRVCACFDGTRFRG
jgi:hypothetical protein